MTRLLAIDPGINGCGVAVFDAGKLVEACYVKSDAPTSVPAIERVQAMARWVQEYASSIWPVTGPAEIALEWPQVYTQGKLKGDPNDLLLLAAVDAAICARLERPATTYRPVEWKGALPKGAAFEARVMDRLTEFERKGIVRCGSLTHNVIDAIGIGLHHLGRFERKRVIAR